MQLRVARLCLDCDEVHDLPGCPVCASESFTYLTRWVPAPEPQRRPAPPTANDVEIYRQLVSGDGAGRRSRGKRLLKQGAVALTVLGVLGVWWQTERTKE